MSLYAKTNHRHRQSLPGHRYHRRNHTHILNVGISRLKSHQCPQPFLIQMCLRRRIKHAME